MQFLYAAFKGNRKGRKVDAKHRKEKVVIYSLTTVNGQKTHCVNRQLSKRPFPHFFPRGFFAVHENGGAVDLSA